MTFEFILFQVFHSINQSLVLIYKHTTVIIRIIHMSKLTIHPSLNIFPHDSLSTPFFVQIIYIMNIVVHCFLDMIDPNVILIFLTIEFILFQVFHSINQSLVLIYKPKTVFIRIIHITTLTIHPSFKIFPHDSLSIPFFVQIIYIMNIVVHFIFTLLKLLQKVFLTKKSINTTITQSQF